MKTKIIEKGAGYNAFYMINGWSELERLGVRKAAERKALEACQSAQLKYCVTLNSEVILYAAIPLPEKTFFLTINPLLISGKLIAPETQPAFNLALNLPVKDLP